LYVVKIYQRPRSDVIAEQKIVNQLSELDIPVVQPMKSVSGSTIVTSARQPTVVFPFVVGTHCSGIELSLSGCAMLGHMLATIHVSLRHVCPPVQQSFFNATISTNKLMDQCDRLRSCIRRQTKPSQFDQFSLDYLQDLVNRLAKLSDAAPNEVDIFTRQYVHGDFQPYNVLFRDERPVAVLDWERLSIQPVALEVVRSIALWFVRPHSGEIDTERAKSFLGGYLAVNKMDTDEIARMIDRFWWTKLHDLWAFEAHYLKGDARTDHIAVANARLFDWMQHNRHSLKALLK